jgi:hypothetical protein
MSIAEREQQILRVKKQGFRSRIVINTPLKGEANYVNQGLIYLHKCKSFSKALIKLANFC